MDDVEPEAARFDSALRAWILSSHADVGMALRESRLAAADSADADDGNHAQGVVREAIAYSLSADRLAGLRSGMERSAHDLAASLAADRPLDLLEAYAAPWSHGLARTVTGASVEDGEALAHLAREVFLGAADATDSGVRSAAQTAAMELARRLPGTAATIHVQTFVALSQTLPHTLIGGWLALFGDAAAVRTLRSDFDLMPRATEELLRHAGASRAVFRRAVEDVAIGGIRIARGDRVVLMLADANHDPSRFPNPDRLDFRRDGPGHLAFGVGIHACSGARLIRLAFSVATGALLATTAAVELNGPPTWIDGFAIRTPASLSAVLRRGATRQSVPVPPGQGSPGLE